VIKSVKLANLVVLLALLGFSDSIRANWIGDTISHGKVVLSSLFEDPKELPPELTFDDLKDYPQHYHFERTVETTFGSPVFFLEAGHRNKPPILLIHGLGEQASKTWLNVIPELEKNYHVFAIDLPGFGLSKGAYFEYSPKEYSKIIDWFISTYIQKRTILIGHSLGGAVSLYFAASYPEQLNRLVLIDAAGILERTSYIKYLAKMEHSTKGTPKAWQRFNARLGNFSDKWVEKSGSFYDPTKLLKNSKHLRKILLSNSSEMNAALALVDTNFSNIDYKNIVPTDLIWGEQDSIAPIRTGYALLANLPKARLHAIQGVGHVPMNSNTTEFNKILSKLLETSILENGGYSDSNDQHTSKDFIPDQSERERIGSCEKDDNIHFSGYYTRLSLNNCKLVTLNKVITENFSSKNSIVEINSSRLGSKSLTMDINSSALTATASQFYGTIESYRSRFDLAGVSLISDDAALHSLESTNLVLSLSRIKNLNTEKVLHGFYQLKKENIEDKL